MRSQTGLHQLDDRLTYTPTTHRISRAKKGKRVHACTECSKIFTRAEHLKRHKMNHNSEAQYRCDVSGCAKAFHREDLLKRHKERHEMLTGGSSSGMLSSASSSRRPSSTFSVSSASSIPPATFAASPTYYPHPVSDTLGPEAMPYITSAMELSSTAPHASMPSTTHATDPSLLAPLAIPTTSAAGPGAYVPDLSYAGSDESPLQSSSSSCYSVEVAQSGFPAPVFGVPPRPRSDSAMSAPEPYYYYCKSPLSGNANPLPWTVEEAAPAHAPQVLSSPYEGSFLPTVVPTRRVSHAAVAGGSLPELRHLILGSTSVCANPPSLGVDVLTVADPFLDLYWKHFDPSVPIIHRPSFSSKSSPALVVAAMVAIGAQFARTQQSRPFAVAVHQRCKEQLSGHGNITSRSPLPNIQAVLLLEYFGLFRAKRIDVQASAHFRSLYSSLFEDRNRRSTDPLARLRLSQSKSARHDVRHEWLRWADLEARRRLTLAAFILDAQQASLFEQDFCHAPTTRGHSNLYASCPEEIWACATAEGWTTHQTALTTVHPQRRLPDMARAFLESDVEEKGRSVFDGAAVLALIISSRAASPHAPLVDERLHQWRRRVDPSRHGLLITYHAYLLGGDTPLRDLLAVTGETWVLGQKLSHPAEFVVARTRLRTWAEGAKARATVGHAAQILQIAADAQSNGQMLLLGGGLHEAWCVYVAALVCWAVGAALRTTMEPALPMAEDPAREMRQYLRAMTRSSGEVDGLGPDACPLLARTAGTLSCVRQWLQGSMSGLLKEGEEVMRKLEQGRIEL
ncbi:MAG: hypothetical protein M1838_006155 [Thelocarpon superellum]|nr:MAG: hypothetical protein M1838_006155 [Thelocarpon superellum]